MKLSDILCVCELLSEPSMHWAANSVLTKPDGSETSYLTRLRLGKDRDSIVNPTLESEVGRLSQGYTFRNRL